MYTLYQQVQCTRSFSPPLCRPLWAGVLHSLAQLPPEAVRAVLELLRAKVLGASEAIPPKLQAQPFTDSALAQVLLLCNGWLTKLLFGIVQRGAHISAVVPLHDA